MNQNKTSAIDAQPQGLTDAKRSSSKDRVQFAKQKTFQKYSENGEKEKCSGLIG